MTYARFAALTLATARAVAAPAFARMPSTPGNVKIASGMLTNSDGLTLYTFDKDITPGKSACNGQCLVNWPAVTAGADAMTMGDWSVVTRDEGAKQWAYKGKPLYTFIQDKKSGDITGEGKGGVWHIAKP